MKFQGLDLPAPELRQTVYASLRTPLTGLETIHQARNARGLDLPRHRFLYGVQDGVADLDLHAAETQLADLSRRQQPHEERYQGQSQIGGADLSLLTPPHPHRDCGQEQTCANHCGETENERHVLISVHHFPRQGPLSACFRDLRSPLETKR
jgi:hypothetical protein